MLQNIYLAVAVIVVLGVGIAAFLLIRRGRRADREELEPVMTADPADAGDATMPEPESVAATTSEPESAAAASEPTFRTEPEPPLPAATAPLPDAPAYGSNGNGSAAKALLGGPPGRGHTRHARRDPGS